LKPDPLDDLRGKAAGGCTTRRSLQRAPNCRPKLKQFCSNRSSENGPAVHGGLGFGSVLSADARAAPELSTSLEAKTDTTPPEMGHPSSIGHLQALKKKIGAKKKLSAATRFCTVILQIEEQKSTGYGCGPSQVRIEFKSWLESSVGSRTRGKRWERCVLKNQVACQKRQTPLRVRLHNGLREPASEENLPARHHRAPI